MQWLKCLVKKGDIILADFLITWIGMSLDLSFANSLIIFIISYCVQSVKYILDSQVLGKKFENEGIASRVI